jgi:hypothetical protein
MDLSPLSPEEIMELKNAIAQHEQTSSHSDIGDDAEFLKPIVEALELVASRLDALTESHGQLEKIVMDDIIGGVKGLYDTNMRTNGISELKGKYGSMFEPLAPAWKDLSGEDSDLMEKLYDIVDELKHGEDYSDEKADSTIKDIHSKLLERVKNVKGIQIGEEEKSEPVAEVAVAKGEPDKIAEMIEKTKRMKERNTGRSIF